MKWLRLHRQMTDGTLAPYFGFYFNKLRWLYRSGVRWLHKWDTERYWSAELRIDQEDLHVSLTPRDQAYFEFFTTGHPIIQGTVTQGSNSFLSVKAACIGVNVQLQDGKLVADPRIRTGARSFNGQDISLVKRAFQVQLIDEPVTAVVSTPVEVFGRPKYLRTLFETFAPGHSHTGVHTRSFAHGRQDDSLSYIPFAGVLAGQMGASSSHNLRDVFFDVPYQDGDQAKPVRDAVINDGIVDWPRASGIQLVKDVAWGQREFAIYIDAFSQITVFPTSQIGTVNGDVQNVAAKYVTTKPAGLPAWVYQMSERFIDWYAANATTGITEFPENDWKIHPDGTKACSVVYKRQAVTFDAAFWSPVTSPSQFDIYNNVFTSVMQRYGAALVGSSDQRYIVATGLIEIGINITLTGAKDEEYDLSITTNVLRDPETTPFCTLFAGYTWYDVVKSNGGTYALKGDLCVWDIERYYRFPPQLGLWGSVANVPGFTSEDAKRMFGVDLYDHERYWWEFPGWQIALINPSLATFVKYITDNRRALYSLKNVTTGEELRTLPATPCGVAKPYYIPPFNLGTDPGHGGAVINFPGGWEMVPWEPRATFARVDMTTLSFVMMMQTGTADWRRVASGLVVDPDPAHTFIDPIPWYTMHPACAVYTFNTFREIMFPKSMPTSYTQPSAFYIEPAQVCPMDKLRAAATDDFRSVHMATDDAGPWTFMPLSGGPPGKLSTVDWTDADMDILRYYIIEQEGRTFPSAPNLQLAFRGVIALPVPVGDLAFWWAQLHTYGRELNQILITNPRFHWQMYSSLIVNSLSWSPWSTFFVHPNGTWAFYDQSRIYNQDGVPSSQGGGSNLAADLTLDFTALVNPSKWEHCIFDRVHLQFTLNMGTTYSTDTTFVDLYNKAVETAKTQNALPKDEVFNFITPEILKAQIIKLPNGAISSCGLSLQLVWTGDTVTYFYGDNAVQFGANFELGIGTGTIDLSLDYLWGAVSPQAGSQRITFSSCLLVETL